MAARTRTLVTLLVLAGLVLIGAMWGWSQVSKPFPGRVDPSPCVQTAIAKGDKVFPQDVLVSVLNAGDRNGLAGSLIRQLKGVGFVGGVTTNAPKGADVPKVQIWAKHPSGPDAQILKSWFGPGTKVVSRGGQYPGLVVVVGDGFHKLAKGRKSVKATTAATICSPPL